MYQTSDSYKQLVYTDSTKHLLNIYIEGNKVNPDHIFDFKSSHILFSNDEFTLGSVEAKLIKFKIHINSLPSTYNNFYVETGINDEIVPIGYFILDSIEKDDNETIVTIKAIDYMTKFEFNYDGSVLINKKGYATLIEILEDICSKAGVELGSSSFLNSEKQIAVYDNTVSAREYLSYIAEQAGGFACIGRDGKLYIKTIGQDTTEIDINNFQDFTWGEIFKVSGISYEDGIRDFNFGNSTNNVIHISSNNMYITEEEQVRNIYNQINNFECYSFEGTSIIDPALDIGDILIINNKKVVYQGDMEYVGKFKASISSKIQPKTKEETTRTVVSEKTKIRRVQSEINQIDGTISQLAQETTENSEKITKVEQDVSKIEQTVESLEDFTREKNQLENLCLTDAQEGEGYILKFIVYGNTAYFSTNEITICVSSKRRGYGDSIYLTTEDERELTTEDEQCFIVGATSYYITKIKVKLSDILRNFSVNNEMYYDTLEVLQDGTIQVIRKIGINSTGDLYLLPNEKIETLEEKIVLPSLKKEVYYFIEECANLQYYSNYITENDYSETFLTKLELGTKITQNAEAVRIAWNQISQYLQMQGIDGKATLNIYDQDNIMLMSLSQDGQCFYDKSGTEIGKIGVIREEDKDTLAFSMPVDWENVDNSRSMAWGINAPDGQFLPIFYLGGYYGAEASEYGGFLEVAGQLTSELLSVVKNLSMDTMSSISWHDGYIWDGTSFSSISLGMKFVNNVLKHWLRFNSEYGYEFYSNNNLIFSATEDSVNITGDLEVEGDLISRCNIGNVYWRGYPMIGLDVSHKYMVHWTDTLAFYVDSNYVGNISDKRLKKEIQQVDEKFINAISELEIKQFKADNRNGQISFGIIAQELIEVFKKYDINPNDYEILSEIQYNIENDTKYYKIEYTQYLILKQLASDKKIEKLEKKNLENSKIIQELIKRIDRLEEQNGSKNK